MNILNATIKELKDAGYAIILWTPEELGDASPEKVEEASIAAGYSIIEALQD